jgi:hypothetical protein
MFLACRISILYGVHANLMPMKVSIVIGVGLDQGWIVDYEGKDLRQSHRWASSRPDREIMRSSYPV